MCIGGIHKSTSRQMLYQGTVGAALLTKLGWLDREIDTIRFTLERVFFADHHSRPGVNLTDPSGETVLPLFRTI